MARGTPARAIGRGTGWEAGIRRASARSHGGGTAWAAEQILSASEHIGEDRAVLDQVDSGQWHCRMKGQSNDHKKSH